MPLLDSLKASGAQPARTTVPDFFNQHPGLVDEVRACRACGFMWPQIAAQIEADYGYTIHPASLSAYLGRI